MVEVALGNGILVVVSASPDYPSPIAKIDDARPNDTPWPMMTWPPPGSAPLLGRVIEVTPVVVERDADALFAALDDDQVWAHVAGRPATAHDYARRLEQRLAAGWLPWAVRLRRPHAGLPAGAVVGISNYLDVSVADARLEIGGTAYTPAAWGTAVNPDTKLTLLTQAFEVLGVGRVQLKTDVRHARSQSAIARLGARYEGTLRRYQRRGDNTVRDTAMFSIIAEDWPAVRDRLDRRVADLAGNE